MEMIFYPGEDSVHTAISQNEPLLVLISFDGQRLIASQIDEGFEHHILLKRAGFPEGDIDKYFRLVVDRSGADWTFVCPPDYSSITVKEKRISEFFKDGMRVIPGALKELGYDVPVEIPRRYRRHFDIMNEEG